MSHRVKFDGLGCRRCRVLCALRNLGAHPDGPEGANLIALGDSIRALTRAGFHAGVKRMGVEALPAPRPAINSAMPSR